MALSHQRSSMLHGILLVALFSCAAFYISEFEFARNLSLSPLVIGMIMGMIYANSLRNDLPETWVPGILFCSKKVLRLGIILYGFRLTFQDVAAVGVPVVVIDAVVVTVTIMGGVWVGRILKMDRGIALLTSIGSGICGAAAVLGAESTIRSEPYKTAVAVSTVVIFGTVSMFLYPLLYRNGLLGLSPGQMGLFTGATLHEVAHVAGAGNSMGGEIADAAVIVKMIRVMMLVPVLLVLGYAVAMSGARRRVCRRGGTRSGGRVAVPWFAIGFLCVIGFNSLSLLPVGTLDFIDTFDTFLLTMAMTALGAETSVDKFRKAGGKPFLLALVLYVWLLAGGYVLVKYLAPCLM